MPLRVICVALMLFCCHGDWPSPLQAYHGHYAILGELVYKYQTYIDSKDEKGRTPLDLAGFKGHK